MSKKVEICCCHHYSIEACRGCAEKIKSHHDKNGRCIEEKEVKSNE